MADSAVLRMVTLKMIAPGEEFLAYRVAVVPESITFTQLAWILEEMLELPKTDRFEFDFSGREKIRGKVEKENSEQAGFGEMEQIGSGDGPFIRDGDALYINSWMEYEESFVFQMLDSEGNPDKETFRYRIMIGDIEEADEAKYSAPQILRVDRPVECAYWTEPEGKINRTLREKYALKRTDTPLYPSLARLKEEAEKNGGGIYWCTRPLCRIRRQSLSMGGAAQEAINMFMPLADENKDLLPQLEDPDAVLTSEQEERIEELRATLLKGLIDVAANLLKQNNVATDITYGDVASLEIFLSGYNLQNLAKLASYFGIHADGLDAKELAHEIAAIVLDPEHMKKEFLKLTEEELDFFEKFMDRRIFTLSGPETIKMTPVMSRDCAFLLSDNFVLIPEDVAAAYKGILASGYRAYHRQIRWLMDCEQCFRDIFAVGPEDLLYELFLQKEEMQGTDRETFRELLSALPDDAACAVKKDGYVYGDWTQEDDNETRAQHILKGQKKLASSKFYIPTEEEIRGYVKEDYPFWEPSCQELKKFYVEDMQLPEDTADRLVYWGYRYAQLVLYMGSFMESKRSEDLVFSSREQLLRFVPLYDDMYIHARVYLLKGHMMADMKDDLLKGWMKNMADELQDTPFRVSFDPRGILMGSELSGSGTGTGKAQKRDTASARDAMKKSTAGDAKKMTKVYPNDPCPCGSGKKYKKCHGRNAK